jgi:hypothetical protein
MSALGLNLNSFISMAQNMNSNMPGGFVGQMFKNMVSNILQGAIEDFAKQMGIPDSVKDIAQGAVAQALGDKQGVQQNIKDLLEGFQKGTGASDSEMGGISRQLDQLRELVQDAIKQANLDNMEGSKKKAKGGGQQSSQTGGSESANGKGETGGSEGAGETKGAGGSEDSGGADDWFMAIARGLAKIAQAQADRVKAASDAVTAAEGNKEKQMEAQQLLSAESQKLNFLMQAINTCLSALAQAMDKAGSTTPK